jgi:hypothetical protein
MAGLKATNGAGTPSDAARQCGSIGGILARHEAGGAGGCRQLSQAKVAAIKNFYDTAVRQPPIPGTVLLFTSEKLRFDSLGEYENVGNLEEPRGKYLIIGRMRRPCTCPA